MPRLKVEAINGTFQVHLKKDCQSPCPFHKPSDHHMVDWPIYIREDRGYLVERFCEHGCGHPDPDSLAYREGNWGESDGIHGCDGCCRE